MRKFFLSIIILTIFCSCNFVIAQDEEPQVANGNQNIQLQQNEDIRTQADETKQEQIDKLNQEMGLGEQRYNDVSKGDYHEDSGKIRGISGKEGFPDIK